MVVDVLSERGYFVTCDVREQKIPISINRETFEFNWRVEREYEFIISFPRTSLRNQWDNLREMEVPVE